MNALVNANSLNGLVSVIDFSRSPNLKFEVYGEEMIEKKVQSNGIYGRVYLPPDWVGKKVKIIRMT
jgi:putative transposon-encoded protein